MDRILEIAAKYSLFVIEDCAHALGASYRGKAVGTFGDASFFSFQTLKPLNTYGGGMAVMKNSSLAGKVEKFAHAERWPSESEVKKKLLFGRAQRILIRPPVFRWTLFPILWAASFIRARPDVYLWEHIRPLDPLPENYRQRFANVQAVLGLAGLRHLESWTATTVRHANLLTGLLSSAAGVAPPLAPEDCTHVYYQYCLRVPDRDRMVRHCIRHGLDIETLHVDVCTRLPLFGHCSGDCPEADTAAQVVQLPVYASLSEDQIKWVAFTVKKALLRTSTGPVKFAASAQR
jgi:dTDP-4-amino-4,6-dideoxygalactose transaminase